MKESDYLWYMENKISGTRIYFESEAKAKVTFEEFPLEVRQNWIVSNRSLEYKQRRDN
jgi:hypothetical protein